MHVCHKALSASSARAQTAKAYALRALFIVIVFISVFRAHVLVLMHEEDDVRAAAASHISVVRMRRLHIRMHNLYYVLKISILGKTCNLQFLDTRIENPAYGKFITSGTVWLALVAISVNEAVSLVFDDFVNSCCSITRYGVVLSIAMDRIMPIHSATPFIFSDNPLNTTG